MFFSCLFLLTQYFFNRFRFLVWSSQIKILYLQDLTNIDLFLTSREVEESLLRHETGPCLAWCYDNKSKLRKNKVCLKEINSFIAHTWFHIIFWMWIFIWIEDFKQWFLVCLSDFLSVCLSVLLPAARRRSVIWYESCKWLCVSANLLCLEKINSQSCCSNIS